MPRIGTSGTRATNTVRSGAGAASKPKTYDHTNFGEAVKASAKSGKPLVVKVGASWCGPCKAMDKNVFKNPEVAKRLQKDAIFVNVEVDRHGDTAGQRQAAKTISQKLGVRSYPTVFTAGLDNKNGTPTPKLTGKGGGMTATGFEHFLDTNLPKAAKTIKDAGFGPATN